MSRRIETRTFSRVADFGDRGGTNPCVGADVGVWFCPGYAPFGIDGFCGCCTFGVLGLNVCGGAAMEGVDCCGVLIGKEDGKA